MRFDPPQTGPELEQTREDGVSGAVTTAGEPMTRRRFYELLDAEEVQREAARLRAKLTAAGESAEARREFDAAIGDLNAAATKTGIWR